MHDNTGEPLPRAAGELAPDSAAPSSGARVPPDVTAAKLHEMLSKLWRQNEEVFQTRLQALRQCHDLMLRDQLDETTRIHARDAAHKFAGILGSFGLHRGTDIMRETELKLEDPDRLGAPEAARLGLVLSELESILALKSRELKQAGP